MRTSNFAECSTVSGIGGFLELGLWICGPCSPTAAKFSVPFVPSIGQCSWAARQLQHSIGLRKGTRTSYTPGLSENAQLPQVPLRPCFLPHRSEVYPPQPFGEQIFPSAAAVDRIQLGARNPKCPR